MSRWIIPAIALLGVGMLLNAAAMYYSAHSRHHNGLFDPAASAYGADPVTWPGGGHIYMMPAQINSNAWGFILLDTASHRVCVYRILTTASRLRLMAVRDFSADLKLSDFNNAAPTPEQVKAMLRMGIGGGKPAPGSQPAR
ncbi:MAG: hypothetical protein HKL96_03525 [Phycisphaerales bacterium]|nr:hypothetical protein [Phycisphaerales bacterium]